MLSKTTGGFCYRSVLLLTINDFVFEDENVTSHFFDHLLICSKSAFFFATLSSLLSTFYKKTLTCIISKETTIAMCNCIR